ncbi:hypothetical protein M501DRAFT_939084 [Patellaria atrata CBS 101060]|uniref:RING-type domain-containing protein n=1 Tax=Patellaria atrata CBS 101060 TaxID=1346257 RepID=A0A9P4S7V1_9PEZI|nr:hypothetical protein M501DRAFT_939084 [Patellaria atrata CBS 101060]
MAEAPKSGLLDLEKQLTCSICTEILYQPLTLLNCLHTFCGSCLKPWFAEQASNAKTPHPYTCPSCRAPVREARSNATVTTLLDMLNQANPDRDRTQEEKDDMDRIFTRGENILPEVQLREDDEDEEDRRIMDQVRELSLQEVGMGEGNLSAPRARRSRERSRDRREREGRSQGARSSSHTRGSEVQHTTYRTPIPARQIEHQSSLRSLLSSSEIDSQQIEEEILRQIMEEGLLDGIDLTNIDVSQEDEISERIAEAYRRRMREREREREQRRERDRSRSREERRSSSNPSSSQTRPSEHLRRPQSERNESAPVQQTGSSRPPVSRPHLLEAVNDDGRTRHRRSSSQGSSRSAQVARSRDLTIGTERPAARSSTDLSGRSQTGQVSLDRGPRIPIQDRRNTDPNHRVIEQWRSAAANVTSNSNPSSPRRVVFDTTTESPPALATPIPPSLRTPNSPRLKPDTSGARQFRSPSSLPSQTPETRSREHSSQPSSSTALIRPQMFPEPSITCDRCGKTHIEYELHYNCPKDQGGNYNLCIRCYRQGKGCLNWFGFGHAAKHRFEQRAPPNGYPPSQDQPHVLTGHRYLRPREDATRSTSPDTNVQLTEDDPSKRLEAGVFCSLCFAFANACFWRCDFCNEGEWGFCNTCVNQDRHCTHPLLPLSHISNSKSGRTQTSDTTSTLASSTSLTSPTTQLIPKVASVLRGPTTIPYANTLFRPLTFSTTCDLCKYPIPPSHTRYHCPQCNDGDYDICTPCYTGLVLDRRIAPHNGHQGWRRCLKGHRMVVVGFEDRNGGQRRVVSRDLARSSSMHPLSPSSSAVPRFPPDGGVGLRLLALWSYWPAEGVTDELAFPKGAEITEAEDINGDWFWGVYCGSKGLLPGGYGRVVGGW